jgi:hypothetical protein
VGDSQSLSLTRARGICLLHRVLTGSPMTASRSSASTACRALSSGSQKNVRGAGNISPGG